MSQIRIVYFGTPHFSSYILEKLIQCWHNPPQSLQNLASHISSGNSNTKSLRFAIQSVITSPDKQVGRKQFLTPSAVSLVAQKYAIPTMKPEKLDQEFIKTHLPFLESDLFIVASYGKIIPKRLLDIPKYGALNVHGSILPKYRGASPIQAAILNGDKTTGITIMLMDEKMDHGPILSTRHISISKEGNYQTLSTKMSQVAVPLLQQTIINFVQGKIKARVQRHARASYCNLIKKEAGYFNINNPPSSEMLDRMIRAYHPWPGVWTRWNNKIVKFLPGGLLQIAGKKVIPFKDFLNGYPDFPMLTAYMDHSRLTSNGIRKKLIRQLVKY